MIATYRSFCCLHPGLTCPLLAAALMLVIPSAVSGQELLPPVISANDYARFGQTYPTPGFGYPPTNPSWPAPIVPYTELAEPSPFGADLGPATAAVASAATTGLQSPFAIDSTDRPRRVESDYQRVLDLFPERHERELIERVREAVQQTEVGEDVTDEEWVTVRGGGNRITWGGRIDTDAVHWLRDAEFGGQPNYVEFRRLRLMASGEGYGVFEYQLELNLAPESLDAPSNRGGNVEVKDAFVAVRDFPGLGYAVIGHFRTPIGLSSLTSTRFIPFMERSLPERMLPDRELGWASFNASPSQCMTWSYGVFFDDLDESDRSIIDDNQGTRAIGRWTWTPYYDQPSGGAYFLHTGLGYSYNRPRLRSDDDGLLPAARTIQFTARPEIHQGSPLIRTGLLDVDHYHVLNIESAWGSGPFTLQSEGTWVEMQSVTGDSSHVWGTYVYGSWFLTGERRPYDRRFAVFRRVIPYENFWAVTTPEGTEAGLGAWELAVRWSHLNFSDVSNQTLHDLTVGLNWYWNPHTRWMLNWIHPIARNSPTASAQDADGDILAARFQVDF